MEYQQADLDAIRTRAKAILGELSTLSPSARLLPVTKNQPPQAILALRGLGLEAVGENRVQEMLDKLPALGGDFSIHLIGRLQTNKIKYIIGRVCMVQSLDRPALAQELDRRAQAAGLRVPVLVEVNIGGEAQKGGVAPEETLDFVRYAARLPALQVRGLMTVMPQAEDPQTLRPLFRSMRGLFERIREEAVAGVQMRELSMGMSHDWRVAAQEGATLVRVGSAIFGPR